MTTPAPDKINTAMDSLRGIIAALDPEGKIKVTRTEVACFLERALRANGNLDRCFRREK